MTREQRLATWIDESAGEHDLPDDVAEAVEVALGRAEPAETPRPLTCACGDIINERTGATCDSCMVVKSAPAEPEAGCCRRAAEKMRANCAGLAAAWARKNAEWHERTAGFVGMAKLTPTDYAEAAREAVMRAETRATLSPLPEQRAPESEGT